MSHPCDDCGIILGFHEVGLICTDCLIRQMLTVLKEVEGGGRGYCPYDDCPDAVETHNPDCKLASVIKKAEAVVGE